MAENGRQKFTLAQQIFLLKHYYKFDGNRADVSDAFVLQFPNTPVPS